MSRDYNRRNKVIGDFVHKVYSPENESNFGRTYCRILYTVSELISYRAVNAADTRKLCNCIPCVAKMFDDG